MDILHICSGHAPRCKRTACYLNGGPCKHTMNRKAAKYGSTDSPESDPRFRLVRARYGEDFYLEDDHE